MIPGTSRLSSSPAVSLRGFLFLLAACAAVLTLGSRQAAQAARAKKIVFIAGKKSHGPGDHEYEKGCRLLAQCLESSPNVKGLRTEVHLDGWPQDPRTLNDADAIVVYCDGSDHNEADHPLLAGDRLQVLDRQMKRGAGLVLLHYTTFAPVKRGGPEYLEWVGGFFDYETGPGANHWYSKIQTASTTATPASPTHPISRGLAPFPLKEEYYYHMRFRDGDTRRVPILATELPNESGPQEVAWAVQRKDGGRGFAYTGGHFHSNWQVENYRKMVLNAIVWAAKAEVPQGGVKSTVSDTASQSGAIRALLITGNPHPAHDWKATTQALKEVLGQDSRFQVDVTEDPEQLATRNLATYDLIIQNFNNWQTATLSAASRAKLLDAVRGGKGLVVVHFANGAWLDWPEYRLLSRRGWLDGLSGHDAFGPFQVQVKDSTHPITQGLKDYDTTDELYFRQHGYAPVHPLVMAHSKVTGQDEPLAFVYQEGKGRVFQCLLGHDANAIRTPGTATLYLRGAAWVANREPATVTIASAPAMRSAAGRFGQALVPQGAGVSAPERPEYRNLPLTVECWTKLNGKGSFNILAAQAPKESTTHWEIYTTAGSGTFSAYLPGSTPSVIDSGVNIVDGQWHHVALIREADRARLYVDGRLVKNTSLNPAEGSPKAGPLWIGAYPPQGIGCDGVIDEVRLSNVAREITGLPNGALVVDAATVGLWTFDTSADGRYADSSRLANATTGAASVPPLLVQPPTTFTGELPRSRGKRTDWPNVGNDKGGMRYTELKQINTGNVKDLQVAWTYHTGDAGSGTTIECTPIVVNGIMYVTTVQAKIVALNPATGQEIWKFDPFALQPQNPIRTSGNVSRGVAYWEEGKEKRILFGTSDGRLVSLDALTGKLDPKFGAGGVVDMRQGIEYDVSRTAYGCTSAPAVFEDTVILGYSVSEGQPGAPGDVRAFDTRTGKEKWRFHTVPRPGEFGNETWEKDSWKERSGTNAWSGFTVDAKNGIVFCGTGSAASDFYGGDRKGNNLFANCTLALDARTGKRLWHFQTVHHDIWDQDNPCPPTLCTVRKDGKQIEAVAQVTKTGYCYLFNRKTGEPLFGVEEVPVPASDVPGEQASPTQPRPLKPPAFARHTFTEKDVTNVSPEPHAAMVRDFRTRRTDGPFNPPSERGSVQLPGFHGGANWSGASFDPTTGLLYVNSNNVPWVAVMKSSADGQFLFGGYTYYNDPNGYPAVSPPWGNLTAIDVSKGEIAWQIVHGEYPDLKAKGVPKTGTENFGGTIVTAGGLLFIGGTKDERFHAYDKKSGKLLWEYQLPAGGYANPCTYMVGGRQYVVIAAGGGGKLRTKSGDSFIAFALPERKK